MNLPTGNRPISQYLRKEHLVNWNNLLECVCLTATSPSDTVESLEHALTRIIELTKASKEELAVAKTISFVLFLSKSTTQISKQGIFHELKNVFASVKVIHTEIPKKYDFYYRRTADVPKEKYANLDYGIASGANYCFFELISQLAAYNTTLLLEPDCQVQPNWLSRVSNYTKYAGGFWKAGPSYDGLLYITGLNYLRSHTNGGCSLYATGCPGFQAYMVYLEDSFLDRVKKQKTLSYDCAYKEIPRSMIEEATWDLHFYCFLDKQHIKTNLFSDFSPAHDAILDTSALLKQYKPAVLHKKEAEKVVPAFLHIPKTAGTLFFNTVVLPYLYRTHTHDSQYGFVNYKVFKGSNALFTAIAQTDGMPTLVNDITTPTHIQLNELTEELGKRIKKLVGFKLFSTTDVVKHMPLIESLVDTEVHYMTILRPPILREESLFYYLRDCGTWEANYSCFPKSETFDDFVRHCPLVSSNWVTRWLSGTIEKNEIGKEEFEQALTVLKRCKMIGFSENAKTFSLFPEAFAKRYNFSNAFLVNKKPKEWMRNRNTVSKKTTILPQTNEAFSKINKWDIKLYRAFREQGELIENYEDGNTRSESM